MFMLSIVDFSGYPLIPGDMDLLEVSAGHPPLPVDINPEATGAAAAADCTAWDCTGCDCTGCDCTVCDCTGCDCIVCGGIAGVPAVTVTMAVTVAVLVTAAAFLPFPGIITAVSVTPTLGTGFILSEAKAPTAFAVVVTRATEASIL